MRHDTNGVPIRLSWHNDEAGKTYGSFFANVGVFLRTYGRGGVITVSETCSSVKWQ
jgi:hypothetical protein